jgi:hypothetical protein
MQLFTSSRAADFARCKRLHYYRYEARRYPTREAEPLSMGKLIHVALEAWWRARQDGLTERACYDQMLGAAYAAIAALDEESELDEFGVQRTIQMLRGYHVRWSHWAWSEAIRVHDVEREFTCPLVNPQTGRPSRTWMLAGRIDAIIELPTGTWIVESPYWQRLRMDGQISTYFEGALSAGYQPIGCLYDVLKKPLARPYLATPEGELRWTKGKGCKECGGSAGGKAGIKQGSGCDRCASSGWIEQPRLYNGQRTKDETTVEYGERIATIIVYDPAAWYSHAEVIRLESEIKEFRADAWVTAKAIREAQLTGGHARNPNACHLYNRACEYWDVCTGSASIDDDGRFESRRIHTELSRQLVEKEGQRHE